jgi:hypothetical protein
MMTISKVFIYKTVCSAIVMIKKVQVELTSVKNFIFNRVDSANVSSSTIVLDDDDDDDDLDNNNNNNNNSFIDHKMCSYSSLAKRPKLETITMAAASSTMIQTPPSPTKFKGLRIVRIDQLAPYMTRYSFYSLHVPFTHFIYFFVVIVFA